MRQLSSIEYASVWRAEARQQGLIFARYMDRHNEDVSTFTYDLNQGSVVTLRDPETILRLVGLAKDEGEAILNLVMRVEDVGKHDIYLHRPYHVASKERPQDYLSLRQWLIDAGYDPYTYLEKPSWAV
jgi:hypothetical protein